MLPDTAAPLHISGLQIHILNYNNYLKRDCLIEDWSGLRVCKIYYVISFLMTWLCVIASMQV